MAWLDIQDYVSFGSLDSVSKALSRLGEHPSTNMLASEGDLLVLAIRSGNANVVQKLWDHCKANFLCKEGTLEDFEAMIDTFYEVANDWEAAYTNTAVLGVINAIQEEFDIMDAQMRAKSKAQRDAQANTNELTNLTPRSPGNSSEGLA